MPWKYFMEKLVNTFKKSTIPLLMFSIFTVTEHIIIKCWKSYNVPNIKIKFVFIGNHVIDSFSINCNSKSENYLALPQNNVMATLSNFVLIKEIHKFQQIWCSFSTMVHLHTTKWNNLQPLEQKMIFELFIEICEK